MIRRPAFATLLLGSIAATPPSNVAADEMTEYGAYLSGECVTCHRSTNAGSGPPLLAGRSRSDLLEALRAFKSGQRASPVMQNIAARLAEDEMLALTEYFSSLPTSTPCLQASSSQEQQC